MIIFTASSIHRFSPSVCGLPLTIPLNFLPVNSSPTVEVNLPSSPSTFTLILNLAALVSALQRHLRSP